MFSKNLIRFYLVVLVLLGFVSQASAQDNPEVKWKDGKKYIGHKIQKGETWSGIARMYKAPMKELQAINPKAKELKFDQSILIPFENYKKSQGAANDGSESTEEKPKTSKTDTKEKTQTVKSDSVTTTTATTKTKTEKAKEKEKAKAKAKKQD